jgi:hypothetical protein
VNPALENPPGVALSGTYPVIRKNYPTVVAALAKYLAGFNACASTDQHAVVGIATNNDGLWDASYDDQPRGTDWSLKIIQELAKTPYAHVRVVGAIDIEAGFASSLEQAEAWKKAYFDAMPDSDDVSLILTGSLDACPQDDSTDKCGVVNDTRDVDKQWNQADYLPLLHQKSAHGAERIGILPPIYYGSEARQWAQEDRVSREAGQGPLNFLGSLTEVGTCGTDCSLTPQAAWQKLSTSVAAVRGVPSVSLPAMVDLNGEALIS